MHSTAYTCNHQIHEPCMKKSLSLPTKHHVPTGKRCSRTYRTGRRPQLVKLRQRRESAKTLLSATASEHSLMLVSYLDCLTSNFLVLYLGLVPKFEVFCVCQLLNSKLRSPAEAALHLDCLATVSPTVMQPRQQQQRNLNG